MKGTIRQALQVGLALGLLTGLGEGAGLWLAQEHGDSRWPMRLSSGAEVIWVAPWVDALLFTALAALVALSSKLLRRPPPIAALAGACTAALAADWLRVTNQVARSHALLIGVAIGVVAWLAARRHREFVVAAARRGAVAFAVVAVLLTAAIEGGARLREARAEAKLPKAPAGARDVVVVVLDTVRSDHLSAYGYARRTTPELERLAAEGARFDSLFSTSSWTLPAHASMLTGRLPYEHGAALEPLDATWPVLGEEMLAHGWRTGAFSGNLCFFQRAYGFGRGFLRFDDFGWSWRSRVGGTLLGREIQMRHGGMAKASLLTKPARAVTDAFLAWLDDAGERPCFAFLNWFDAHDPYRPPPGFKGRFAHDGHDPAPMPPELPVPDPRPWTDATIARGAAAYDECVLALDAELGRLRRELERRHRLDRTILVVLGDHGESFGENGARLHRGSLQREQVQVPMVVRAPGLVPAGSTVARVGSLASLPATLLAMAGLPAGPFPGPSLAGAWDDEHGQGDGSADDDAFAVLEMARHPWHEYRHRVCHDGALRAIVRGRWHYVWHETNGPQLFDRATDPREEHDVKDDHPEVAAALDQMLNAALSGLIRHPREPMGLDFADHPELAGIGYADDGK